MPASLNKPNKLKAYEARILFSLMPRTILNGLPPMAWLFSCMDTCMSAPSGANAVNQQLG